MSATLDIAIDTGASEAIEGGSIIRGELPVLTKSDSYNLRLRLMEKGATALYQDIIYGSSSLKIGIGDIEERPSDGNFKLFVNGTTSSNIPYNATAVSVYNAVSNNVSTVLQYGASTFCSYLLTASQPNTAMSFGADTFTLFPSSSILVSTRRAPTAGVNAQQTIRIFKNPVVYSDSFSLSPTAGEVSLTKIQDGGSGANETYSLTISNTALGGSFALGFGPNSTSGIPININSTSFTELLQAVTGIGSGNVSVEQNQNNKYTIQFCGNLAQTNITTSLILDAAGINFIPYQQTTLNLNTSELEDLFAEAGENEITTTLEIELTQNGTPKTILQYPVTIRSGLITGNPSQLNAQAQYYTKAEADALFIEDSVLNVDATNRKLADSEGDTSVNYGARKLFDEIGTEVLRYDSGLGFFGSTAISQPNNTNVLSALTNLGLIASSVTIGAQIFAGVVTNSASNVDATNRKLNDGTSIAIDYGNKTLNASGLTVLAWADPYELKLGYGALNTTIVLEEGCSVSAGTSEGSKFGTTSTQKISFWGSTPVTQPNQTNVVTALRGCGLLANSSSTYGVFPLSPKTLTTTASLAFGSVGNNSSNSVTISLTGASINDIVLIGLPSAVSSGLSFLGHITGSDVVEIDAVNATNSTINQSTQTFRITVIGY